MDNGKQLPIARILSEIDRLGGDKSILDEVRQLDFLSHPECGTNNPTIGE